MNKSNYASWWVKLLSFSLFIAMMPIGSPADGFLIARAQEGSPRGIDTSSTMEKATITATSVVLEGLLSSRWQEEFSSDGPVSLVHQYVLHDKNDHSTILLIGPEVILPAGWPGSLIGKNVSVKGNLLEGAGRSTAFWDPLPILEVESIETSTFKQTPASSLISGTQPYVTILCKFPEEVATYPKTWFETLMGDQYPGVDYFWREVSYDTINLTGSSVVGWYDLPKTREQYASNGGSVNNDCLTLADADVYFPDYVGINLVLDKQFTTCCNISAIADIIPLGFDGGGQYGITYTGTSTFTPHYILGVLQHEMGHTFGMGHSSGTSGDVYDSGWDVMSGYGSGLHCYWIEPDCYQHPDYAYLGPHTIAYNKTVPGWIAEDRIFHAAVGTVSTITFEQLADPPAGNYLMAQVAIDGSTTEYYTVEVRKFVAYDAFLAQRQSSEGVVIHKVDITRDLQTGPADVMDGDQNGNPNDAGAVWIPGETYVDVTNGISILVLASTITGYVVKIVNKAAISSPNIFQSTGMHDGWILESTETSGGGGTKNNIASTLRIGDDAGNRQYRSILSFDTAALPDDADIASVTLKFKHAGVSGTTPFKTHGNLLVDIRTGGFNNDNIALQLSDFKALASKTKLLTYTKTKVDNWYSQTLNPLDFQFINLTGVTQFRLRFSKDDNNDFSADFLKIFSGNADPANQPQLIIAYYVP